MNRLGQYHFSHHYVFRMPHFLLGYLMSWILFLNLEQSLSMGDKSEP